MKEGGGGHWRGVECEREVVRYGKPNGNLSSKARANICYACRERERERDNRERGKLEGRRKAETSKAIKPVNKYINKARENLKGTERGAGLRRGKLCAGISIWANGFWIFVCDFDLFSYLCKARWMSQAVWECWSMLCVCV